jgi:hypothetical protein
MAVPQIPSFVSCRNVFPVALRGCETWEKHKLKVVEKTIPRGIFGTKCKEVTGGWRKLQNKTL